ncbi:unnamed protein product [Tuber aestivum]|uniref:Large ribosomal subunit protein mL49 n=1 Tax=Tuber aestivum TaxID=59557 RepID=A0A292PMH3_9PEZI|nr:unnamed protein product [Tuber aestivum]
MISEILDGFVETNFTTRDFATTENAHPVAALNRRHSPPAGYSIQYPNRLVSRQEVVKYPSQFATCTNASRTHSSAASPLNACVKRTLEPLPYFVYRTENNNLPVYQEYKAGGNKLQTRIRKVEGNLQFLRNQIEDAFQMKKGQVTINSLAGHVIIKGRRRDEIVRFLLDHQF